MLCYCTKHVNRVFSCPNYIALRLQIKLRWTLKHVENRRKRGQQGRGHVGGGQALVVGSEVRIPTK